MATQCSQPEMWLRRCSVVAAMPLPLIPQERINHNAITKENLARNRLPRVCRAKQVGLQMSSPAARQRWFDKRNQILDAFCAKYDLRITLLNRGYQQRVESLVDFYPVNGRYCILQTGERGDWNTPQDIRRIMLKALPEAKQRIVYNPNMFSGGLDFSPESIAKEDAKLKEYPYTYGIDMASSQSYSEQSYIYVSRNWLHDRWLRWCTRKQPNHVVVAKKIFDRSLPLKVDASKSIKIEHTDEAL